MLQRTVTSAVLVFVAVMTMLRGRRTRNKQTVTSRSATFLRSDRDARTSGDVLNDE